MTKAAARPIKPTQSLVAFVDVLGFSQRVREARNVEHVLAIADAVSLVQREFEAHPRSEERAVRGFQAKRVLAFSDCVVISIGVNSKMTRMEGTYDPIMMQICGLAYARAACVLRGTFLRGGLELGWLVVEGEHSRQFRTCCRLRH